MQNRFDLLVTDVMPIYMIMPRYSHNMLNSVNCSTVICSPTVKYLCSREKPLVKPMAPGSIFHHINLPSLSYFLCLLFCFYFTLHLYHKNTKNIILSYLSDLTLVSDREGIDNPLSRWLWGFICLCRCEGLVRGLLLDWYLGSQKLREILTLLYCITHSCSRENQRSACSRGSIVLETINLWLWESSYFCHLTWSTGLTWKNNV